ncbi:uncharacterized protein LOC9659028 [Selaginella moellendorffii]|uniref:uncharacterized protein LOC9659028 n=1 Tax=Selaginella moellendorffii TaxID=88036 RepID=UPI000D1C6095|nr:uncharacterized protein LOC9659028 [Selaginella moellendorffii]|eukprot:XP_024525318.1 uncharacterized protein LOC9659028 [Selaginella moellendorffii]
MAMVFFGSTGGYVHHHHRNVSLQSSRAAVSSSLFAPSSSISNGYLKVSELHTIYYETFGNRCGQSAVFLHGGPGAGCTRRHAQFFDSQRYHIVLLDQRGCGKSTPKGCLQENTTWDLVDDLEKLRKHLNVERWLVLGGSWGATLGLAYAQAYPQVVHALILRGVCLFRQREIDWIYKQGGASSIFPFSWKNFVSVLEPDEQNDVLTSFYKRLTSSDPSRQLSASRAWFSWEMALSFFSVEQSLAWNGEQYSNPSGKILSLTAEEKTNHQTLEWLPTGDAKMPSQVVQARLECHYSMRNGFLKDQQLLEGVRRIRHIPCVIIHGRYDFVCPVVNAVDLHCAWPEAELKIVGDSGHSMYEKGIARELVLATNKFLA